MFVVSSSTSSAPTVSTIYLSDFHGAAQLSSYPRDNIKKKKKVPAPPPTSPPLPPWKTGVTKFNSVCQRNVKNHAIVGITPNLD